MTDGAFCNAVCIAVVDFRIWLVLCSAVTFPSLEGHNFVGLVKGLRMPAYEHRKGTQQNSYLHQINMFFSLPCAFAQELDLSCTLTFALVI